LVTADHQSSEALDVEDAVKLLFGIVLSDHSFAGVLLRTAQVAKRTIPGADEVSVTIENSQPRTVASTGSLAEQADDAQYDAGHGPCLDALRYSRTIVVRDQTTETRWPDYGPRAVDAGVRSSVSVPLPVDEENVGGLNVYGQQIDGFDQQAVEIAERLASYAGIILNNAGLYFTASARADQLTEAMQSRATIEQAKGILMGTRRCTADEAFATLVQLSQQSHRKLHDVARALVEQTTGSTATPDVDLT
jgi:GAF domain-containing protein